MKRSDFLKRLGLGAVAAVAAPQVVQAIVADKEEYVTLVHPDGQEQRIGPVEYVNSPYTTEECWRSGCDQAMERERFSDLLPELVKKYEGVTIMDFLKTVQP